MPIQLPDLDYAPKWQRGFHFLIDTLLGLVIGWFVVRSLLPLLPVRWLEALLEWPEKWVNRGLRWGTLFGFYLLTEVAFKTTPGKLLTRAVVTDAKGREPRRKRLLLRTMCRFIPLEWLSFFGRDGTGWHDAASKTYVLRRRSMEGTAPGGDGGKEC